MEIKNATLHPDTRSGRQVTLVPFSDGADIRDYAPSAWTQDTGTGILRDYWPGLVRWWRDPQGRGVYRRRPELEGSEPSDTGASESTYPVYCGLGLGRRRGGAPVSLHG